MSIVHKEYLETGSKCKHCEAPCTGWLIVERTDPGWEWATWLGPFCDGCREKAVERSKEVGAT